MTTNIADLPATVRGDLGAVASELRQWRPSRERAVFSGSMVAAVLIAVALAHALQRSETWWVTISSFAVMQAGFGVSLLKAVRRVLETLIGAGLGLLAFAPASTQPWLAAPILALIESWRPIKKAAEQHCRWLFCGMLGLVEHTFAAWAPA